MLVELLWINFAALKNVLYEVEWEKKFLFFFIVDHCRFIGHICSCFFTDPDQGPRGAGRGDFERERGAPDAARHHRRAAGLRAGRPRQEVRRLRPLHGRLDVDHGLPRAGAHPCRAANAEAPRGRARARVRGGR